MDGEEKIVCPFCGYTSGSDYQIMLHLETLHPETGDSPFVAKGTASITGVLEPKSKSKSGNGEHENDIDDGNDEYFHCPVAGCGEALLPVEIESHLEMHEEEKGQFGDGDSDSDEHEEGKGPGQARAAKDTNGNALKPAKADTFDIKLSHALRNLSDDDEDVVRDDGSGGGQEEEVHVPQRVRDRDRDRDPHAKTKAAWKKVLKMPQSSSKGSSSSSSKPGARRRLGRSELGPHAHEKQMPSWLVKLLEDDGTVKTSNVLDKQGNIHKVKICPNMTAGIVPVLKQLLDQDEQVEFAYLCDPAVRHVSKLRKEGGFCGYRNIQMMCSYIIGAESQGCEVFRKKVPSIFQIQEYIETAWDMGINSACRIETGGIRGTRKYIGTPEAQAMLCSLGIACNAQALRSSRGSGPAYDLLFRSVENYFTDGCEDYNPKIRCTSLPSIYFQHPGHSMTIIGIELKTDGTKNLLVFDPMFHDSLNVTKLIGQSFNIKKPADHLRAYRRGVKYLKKYDEFEMLKLTPPRKIPKIDNPDDESKASTNTNGNGIESGDRHEERGTGTSMA